MHMYIKPKKENLGGCYSGGGGVAVEEKERCCWWTLLEGEKER